MNIKSQYKTKTLLFAKRKKDTICKPKKEKNNNNKKQR